MESIGAIRLMMRVKGPPGEEDKMKKRPTPKSSGFALMLVLVIITFLVIITTAFSKTMISSYKIAADNELSALALYTAESGLQLAMERILVGNYASFACDGASSETPRIIELGDIPEHPELQGEARIEDIVPGTPATSGYTKTTDFTLKSTGRILSNNKLAARKILQAKVRFVLDQNAVTNPPRQKATVTIVDWYEDSR